MEIIDFAGRAAGREREKPSFERLYEDNYTNVCRYIYKKLGNIHDAEDLAGEVFLYCYDHYDSYDPEKSAVTTWLYLVVNSRLKNHYRDKKETADFSLLENVVGDENLSPERGVYLEQLRETLAKAIGTLPERQRQIVIMRYFQDRSSEDIAEALGLSSGNVRVLLSRALDKLEALCRGFREGEF